MQGVAAPRSYGRVRNSTIQRNVDDETTYETSEMKQPKRPGLASSWQRRSSPQSGVVTLFDLASPRHGRDAALLRAVSSRSSTPGLASSWQRRSSPQSGVVTLFDNRDMVEPSFCPPLSPRSAIPYSLRRRLAAGINRGVSNPTQSKLRLVPPICMGSLSGTCNSASR
jgi:hypothetical protein